MSQIALATAAGVDPKTLRGLETGQRWPQVQKRAAIAEALGWEPRTLERIRADIKSPEHAPRFNSSDAIPAAADDRGPRDEGDSERRAREQDEAALHSQEPDDE